MFGAYSFVLRTSQVPSRLLAVFLSAVPLGMLSLTIVLSVQEWTGTLQAAGLISGLFGMGNAIGLTAQGPLMDRIGSRPVVTAAGGICTAALLGFGVVGSLGGPLWIVAVLAGIAGVSVPAITTAVRAWLSYTLADQSHRSTSYALLSALFQGAITVGPVLVSLSLIIHGPHLAVGLAAVLILSATSVYSLTGDRRTQRPATGSTASREARGTLSSGFLTLLVATGLNGLAVGVTAIAIPGVMTNANIAALAGVAFAAPSWWPLGWCRQQLEMRLPVTWWNTPASTAYYCCQCSLSGLPPSGQHYATAH